MTKLSVARRPWVPRQQYRHGAYRHFISTTPPVTHWHQSWYIMSLQNAYSIIIFRDHKSSYPIPNPHPTPFCLKISPDSRQCHEWSWSGSMDPPPSYAPDCFHVQVWYPSIIINEKRRQRKVIHCCNATLNTCTVNLVAGLFAPQNFRSRERKFQELSLSATFSSWNFLALELSDRKIYVKMLDNFF